MVYEALPPPSRETLELVRREFGLNERTIKDAVKHIIKWLEQQPHLPNDFEEEMIERWIIRCKNNLEKTKKTLDMYFTLKTFTPELLINWNTNADWYRKCINVVYDIVMPQLTPAGDRVIILGIQNSNPSKFDFSAFLMLTIMVLQIRMREDYCVSDVYVLDFSKLGIGHVPKFSYPLLKKWELCVMKGFNLRVKEVHFVDLPPAAEFLLSWGRLAFKPKIVSRFHLHNSLDSLHKYVPPHVLPYEFGGQAGTVDEHWGRWKRKLESCNDWFARNEKVRSDESKRPGGKLDFNELLGFDSSFRNIEVD